jgi:hypothetical protein
MILASLSGRPMGRISIRRGVAVLALMICLRAAIFAQRPASLHDGFLNPPDEASPMMRWWWFGPAVVKPELKKELETMRSVGIGGVEIQPVYPMMLDDAAKGIKNIPYMSPEFLDDVSYANTTARELGMRVSITLGSGWPYGGPRTSIDLAAGKLKVVGVPFKNGNLTPPKLQPGEQSIATFLVSGTEKSFDPSTARLFGVAPSGPFRAPGEQSVLFFIASHTGQQVKRAAFGAEGNVLDHFSRAAIDEHLNDVATPLVNAFGSQPPSSVFSDSLEVYLSDWTPRLPAEFEKRRGYDLIPHLPELWQGGTPEAEAVRHDWGVTLSELIRENYLAPLTQFAEAHHTLFRSQTYGEPAVTLADEVAANLPEGEGPQWRAFSFTRWASSANHLYGNNVTSAETWTWLHSPAFRATPLDMKVEADRMFLLGVNQFVGHGYPYSPPGAGEPGWSLYAAAVFNSHNPWFPLMPDITKYLQRVSWLLRQGKPANDIAILLPEDDAQAAFTPGHVSVTDEMKKRITPQLMSAILDAGYNVDYIDAATIEKLGTIPYPVLVMPASNRIPLSVYKKIQLYVDGPGKVIAIGAVPSLAPGLMQQGQSKEIASISKRLFTADGHRGIFLEQTSELPDALAAVLTPDLTTETGQMGGLGFIHRKLPDSDIYFVANTINEPIHESLRFRALRSVVEAWDPDSGRVLEVNSRANQLADCTLAPYESRVFVLRDHVEAGMSRLDEASLVPGLPRERRLQDLSSGWIVRFGNGAASKPMVLLDSWTEIEGRKFYSGEGIYTRSFTMERLPAASSHVLLDFGEGTPIEDDRPPNANGIHALLDAPIREAAIVYVNGQKVGSLWHPPYRMDVSHFVHRGENKVEVRVYNTAINELAGQPPHDFKPLVAKYGDRFQMQDMDHLHPIPSGLVGSISLVEEAKGLATR